MRTPDYSARDKPVIRNVYASVRRRDGVTHDQFTTYWRDVHSTLCSRLPGLGFYVQQHFERDGGSNLWPITDGVRRIEAVLDGSAELGFLSDDGQAQFGEASKILYADERNLFGEAIAYFLPSGSTTFVDRDENDRRNGAEQQHRIHVYMNQRPERDAAKWLRDISGTLATMDEVQKWKLHLPQAYDNAHPAPPSPDVSHVVDDDRLNIGVAEIAFDTALAARQFFERPAVKKVLEEQSKYLSAIGAYRVSGYYTFVRDGEPTLAGIRGSSAAELIEALGASNQATDDVRYRYVNNTAQIKT